MPLPCRAVIFDFDGVIVDSNPIKVAALVGMYREHGPEFCTEIATYYRLHAGLSRDRKFRHIEQTLLGRPVDEGRIAELSRRFSEMVEEAVTDCPVIPGAVEFVQKYAGTMPLFVASGTPEVELQRIVARRGWAPLFVEVRGSPTHKNELVAEIIRNNGLSPARTVMVGDALTDQEAALVNGLPFVGIVPRGEDDIFPAGTRIEPDLAGLEAAIRAVTFPARD